MDPSQQGDGRSLQASGSLAWSEGLARMKPTVRLVYLYHPETDRKIRLEVPTVFGRHGTFYSYPKEERFSAEEAEALQRLDYVEIEGDNKISRTHGVLDPTALTIQDLNSRNGVWINAERVPTTPGQVGPVHPVKDGDVLQLGAMVFEIQTEAFGRRTLETQLAVDRHAVVAPVGSPEAGVLGEFLLERKRFQVRAASDWRGILDALEAIGPKQSTLGITVVGLDAEPDGDVLRCGEAVIRAEALIGNLNALPGSKILALQASGDPSAFERVFEERAFQDTILVTSTVSSVAGIDDGVEMTIATSRVGGRRKALSGEDADAYHSVLDGLDAMINPDTNVLGIDWLTGYSGALRVVIGRQRHAADVELELSYRTDTSGTFRIRHHFGSAQTVRGNITEGVSRSDL